MVIRLLNQNGQGVNYDEVQAVDTTWALQQINEHCIVISSNMNQGTFTHTAADNWNRATDAVTGKHLDIVNLIDRAWIFLSICPKKLFEIQVTDEIPEDAPQQDVPGWTTFHAIISNHPSVPTNIGYCQAIPSPLSDFNTVYTVLKRTEALFRRIGQEIIIMIPY